MCSDSRLPGVVTDAYDNESKVAGIEVRYGYGQGSGLMKHGYDEVRPVSLCVVQGHFFVIWAENDHMMPATFAERLFSRHYKPLLISCQEATHQSDLWTKDRILRGCFVCGSSQ